MKDKPSKTAPELEKSELNQNMSCEFSDSSPVGSAPRDRSDQQFRGRFGTDYFHRVVSHIFRWYFDARPFSPMMIECTSDLQDFGQSMVLLIRGIREVWRQFGDKFATDFVLKGMTMEYSKSRKRLSNTPLCF